MSPAGGMWVFIGLCGASTFNFGEQTGMKSPAALSFQ
jgi:hypothetical protein